MKAILEFNLPDDQLDFDLYNNASKVSRCLNAIFTQFRSWDKYEEKHDWSNSYQDLWDIVKDHDVDPWAG
jgi:hypothetical protein